MTPGEQADGAGGVAACLRILEAAAVTGTIERACTRGDTDSMRRHALKTRSADGDDAKAGIPASVSTRANTAVCQIWIAASFLIACRMQGSLPGLPYGWPDFGSNIQPQPTQEGSQ